MRQALPARSVGGVMFVAHDRQKPKDGQSHHDRVSVDGARTGLDNLDN